MGVVDAMTMNVTNVSGRPLSASATRHSSCRVEDLSGTTSGRES